MWQRTCACVDHKNFNGKEFGGDGGMRPVGKLAKTFVF